MKITDKDFDLNVNFKNIDGNIHVVYDRGGCSLEDVAKLSAMMCRILTTSIHNELQKQIEDKKITEELPSLEQLNQMCVDIFNTYMSSGSKYVKAVHTLNKPKDIKDMPISYGF